MDDDLKWAGEYLAEMLKNEGVGAIKVKDGELFAFKRDRVEDLIKQMDKSGKDSVIVFVKTLKKEELN